MKRTYMSPKIEVLSPVLEHSLLGFIVSSHSIDEGFAKPQNNFGEDTEYEDMLQEDWGMVSKCEGQP